MHLRPFLFASFELSTLHNKLSTAISNDKLQDS